MAYNFYQNTKMMAQQINANEEQYEEAIQNRINDNVNQLRSENFNYQLALNQEEQAKETLAERGKAEGYSELIQSGIELPAGLNSIKNSFEKVKQVYNNLGNTADNAKSLVDNISQKLSDAPSNISEAVQNLKSGLQEKVSQGLADVKSTIGEATGRVQGLAQETIGKAQGLAQETIGKAQGLAQEAVGQAQGLAQEATGQAQGFLQQLKPSVGAETREVQYSNPLFEPDAISATKTATSVESNFLNADQSRAYLNSRIDNFYGEGQEVANSIQKDLIASKSDTEVIRAANRGQFIPEGQPITMDNFNKYKSADAPEWLSTKGGAPLQQFGKADYTGAQASGVPVPVLPTEQVPTASGLNPETFMPNEEIGSTKQVIYNVAQGGEAEASAIGEQIGAGISGAVESTAPLVSEGLEAATGVVKKAGGFFSDLFGSGQSIFGDIAEGISDVIDPVAGFAAAGLGAMGLIEGAKSIAGANLPSLPTPPPPSQMIQSYLPQADITAVGQPGV